MPRGSTALLARAGSMRALNFISKAGALTAGAQFYSVGCDAQGPLAAVQPDGQGGFRGEARGKVALLRETERKTSSTGNKIMEALAAAGALAAVMVSEYRDTYSTKMFRNAESKLPAAGVSGAVGEQLHAAAGKEVRLVIRARQTQSRTGNVLGRRVPRKGPRSWSAPTTRLRRHRPGPLITPRGSASCWKSPRRLRQGQAGRAAPVRRVRGTRVRRVRLQALRAGLRS